MSMNKIVAVSGLVAAFIFQGCGDETTGDHAKAVTKLNEFLAKADKDFKREKEATEPADLKGSKYYCTVDKENKPDKGFINQLKTDLKAYSEDAKTKEDFKTLKLADFKDAACYADAKSVKAEKDAMTAMLKGLKIEEEKKKEEKASAARLGNIGTD